MGAAGVGGWLRAHPSTCSTATARLVAAVRAHEGATRGSGEGADASGGAGRDLKWRLDQAEREPPPPRAGCPPNSSAPCGCVRERGDAACMERRG
eukprot:2842090-Rhodomonas_salina.2